MRITALSIPDVLLCEPRVFSDARGCFYESFNAQQFANQVGQPVVFVQDNCSYSNQAVLRGLHYQVKYPQAKLVSVVQGEVFDVAVDIRKNSPTLGQWVGEILSAENKRQLWIPAGFAHGFLVLSSQAIFQYKVTDYWYPEHERCIRFDDETLQIKWPIVMQQHTALPLSPCLSDKDRQGLSWADADLIEGNV